MPETRNLGFWVDEDGSRRPFVVEVSDEELAREAADPLGTALRRTAPHRWPEEPPPRRGGLLRRLLSRIALVAVLAALVASLAGCGGGSSSTEKVWCVAPGEKVTAKLKAEYPELYMDKSACEAINR